VRLPVRLACKEARGGTAIRTNLPAITQYWECIRSSNPSTTQSAVAGLKKGQNDQTPAAHQPLSLLHVCYFSSPGDQVMKKLPREETAT
jgi:hypothetical protein